MVVVRGAMLSEPQRHTLAFVFSSLLSSMDARICFMFDASSEREAEAAARTLFLLLLLPLVLLPQGVLLPSLCCCSLSPRQPCWLTANMAVAQATGGATLRARLSSLPPASDPSPVCRLLSRK